MQVNDNGQLIDVAPFACALNSSMAHFSECKVDIRNQPFEFKEKEWGLFGDFSKIKE
jgi:hypothetical protein